MTEQVTVIPLEGMAYSLTIKDEEVGQPLRLAKTVLVGSLKKGRRGIPQDIFRNILVTYEPHTIVHAGREFWIYIECPEYPG